MASAKCPKMTKILTINLPSALQPIRLYGQSGINHTNSKPSKVNKKPINIFVTKDNFKITFFNILQPKQPLCPEFLVAAAAGIQTYLFLSIFCYS